MGGKRCQTVKEPEDHPGSENNLDGFSPFWVLRYLGSDFLDLYSLRALRSTLDFKAYLLSFAQ
jgi:hypothetical protein